MNFWLRPSPHSGCTSSGPCPVPEFSFYLRARARGALNCAFINHFLNAHEEFLTAAAPSNAVNLFLSVFRKRTCSEGRHIVVLSTTGKSARFRRDQKGNSTSVAKSLPRPDARSGPAASLLVSPSPPLYAFLHLSLILFLCIWRRVRRRRPSRHR